MKYLTNLVSKDILCNNFILYGLIAIQDIYEIIFRQIVNKKCIFEYFCRIKNIHFAIRNYINMLKNLNLTYCLLN